MFKQGCRLLCCLILTATADLTEAATITQWNFNTLDSNPGTGTANPNVGSGTVAVVVAAFNGFSGAQGGVQGESSDPALTVNDSAYRVAVFPANGTGNKTAGIQFNVSTVGFDSINISWDQRAELGAARDAQFQYSTNGSTFVDFETAFLNLTTWENQRLRNLTSIPGAANNPNFAFRVVAAFSPPGNTTYSGTGTVYFPNSAWLFDMVTVNGNPVAEPSPVPEPSSWVLLGTGIAGVLVVRRRRAAVAS